MQNLWKSLPPVADIQTPEDILREQASNLTNLTDGVLRGIVKPCGGFAFEFCIQAPRLNSYEVTLFTVLSSLEMYPLDLVCEHLGWECKSEASFLEKLEKIFNSSKTQNIISGLLAHSKSRSQLEAAG